MTDFGRLLAALASHDVRYIIVGGFAATAHGSAFLTVDLDVVYERTAANIGRLVAALEPLSPYLRGAPPGLPFRFVDLERLIRLKRAARRPKDLERIAELEALRFERRSPQE